MAYEVLARKWRPKTFDDVVGQGHVTRTLANAIEQDRIAHAYLFIGPRGIGKTTLSRILAMALNCEKGPTTHPCGECDNCKGIAAGSDMDVIELDAASNNKVEDIHAVLDQVQFAPTHSRFKVFILDEVHMLSNAAFNALLKTLEEPPPYVKFIFATTEGDKVLPTIVSRCQRFDLRRISVGDIVQRLRFICNAEKIEITDDALLAIARGSNGGLRDALSALDQLIAFKGTDLSEADVLAVFGLVSREALEGLAESILKGDIPGILRTVAALDESGKDMRRMTAELLWHFRNLLVCQQAGAELAKQDVTAEQLAVLEAQAKLAPPQRIVEISSLLSEMEGKLRAALSVRTLVEMTLIRCARAAKTVSLDEEKPEPEVAPDLSEKKAEPQPEPETSPIDDLWADALSKGQWPFDKAFFIILNQSVGNGSWAANADVSHTYETLFDWVRVYQIGSPEVGIDDITEKPAFSVSASRGQIHISCDRPSPVSVFDASGRTVWHGTVQAKRDIPVAGGIYIVAGTKVLVP